MTDHKPSEPSPQDFKETAERSQEAGIADESAAYAEAAATDQDDQAKSESSAHPS